MGHVDRTPWRVPVWVVAVVAGLGLLGTSCSTGDEQNTEGAGGTLAPKVVNEHAGPPQAGGRLVYGVATESDGFSPVTNAWGSSTYIAGMAIMDPLAAFGADHEPAPYLARAITANTDFTEWTIALRPGVKLSDGNPVDASLVKANLDAQRASVLTADTLAFVKDDDGVTTSDDHTVVVHMKKPWSTFPHVLTSQVGFIAARQNLTAEGADKPVGSGPFILSEWVRGRSMIVRKNPDYWRKGYPYLDEVEFRPMGDAATAANAFDSHNVNVFETSDPHQILTVTDRAKDNQLQITSDPAANSTKILIGFNVTKPPFDDLVARQAVAHALDTDALSETLYEGVYQPARSVYNTGIDGFVDVPEYPRFNAGKARDLARDYEARHGKPIEFTFNLPPQAEVRSVGVWLQEQLKAVGITMTIVSLDPFATGLAAFTGQFQATGMPLFGSPHLDREYVFLASLPVKDGISLNFTRLGLGPDGRPNGEGDKIIAAMDKARATGDPVEQKRQYAIVQREMARTLTMVFLVSQRAAVVFDNDTHGVVTYPLPDAEGRDGKLANETTTTGLFAVWRSKP